MALPQNSGPTDKPVLVPTIYLDRGRILTLGPHGLDSVLDESGKPIDPFEVADRLVGNYQRFCIVDLEGIRRNRAQLEYLQELSRSGELWVDAGVRTGDQVIDVLVTGARRAILSTAYLLGARELRKAWRLSTEVLFAVETDGRSIRPRGNDWDGVEVAEAVAGARKIGIADIVLRGRGAPVDWSFVQQQASLGPIWVGDELGVPDVSRLQMSGAAGVLFTAPRSQLLAAPDGH